MNFHKIILMILTSVFLLKSADASNRNMIIGDAAGCIESINRFIVSKNYQYELDVKNYDLIVSTISQCNYKWPTVRILDTTKVRLILLWRAEKGAMFEKLNSDMAKVALPLVLLTQGQNKPQLYPIASSRGKSIDEIAANDPEFLQYNFFFWFF